MNTSYDPYDIWSMPSLGKLKYNWSKGKLLPKLIIPLIGVAEVFFPIFLRKLLGTNKHSFAHIEAMQSFYQIKPASQLIMDITTLRVNDTAWGLPFGWYSKNGIYGNDTPYITNTPYVMEALISLAERKEDFASSMSLFNDTWRFLESLEIKYETDNQLALSYAPISEPRIVINANSYAALAYALHAVHGKEEIRGYAQKRVHRVMNWLVEQQRGDGSWLYYLDDDDGNFIDCFHSCFIVKNMIKVSKLLPSMSQELEQPIKSGWKYIRSKLFDSNYGLCRRFSVQAHRDPFKWELYDQAEYLGLLIDFGLLNEAKTFSERVKSIFFKDEKWYCRIDIFGRRWGKDFMRWGIVPFLYQYSRLEKELSETR